MQFNLMVYCKNNKNQLYVQLYKYSKVNIKRFSWVWCNGIRNLNNKLIFVTFTNRYAHFRMCACVYVCHKPNEVIAKLS